MNENNGMFTNNGINQNDIMYSNNKTNNNKIIIIIGIIIGLLVIIFFINNNSKKSFYGTWDCNGITLYIDNKNFNMNQSQLDVKSTYKIKSNSKDGTINKYDIEASAIKRVVNGKEYTGAYTTKFQIAIDEKNKNTMTMINVVSYNIYECTRKD